MTILVICCSQRRRSESARIGRFVTSFLKTEFAQPAETLELAATGLQFWDDETIDTDGRWRQFWAPISKQLETCDGIVIVCPEWGGMAPPILKNFLLMASPTEVGDKPGLIISVSSGVGGAYPIAELRASGYKNNRICFIPDHIVIRKCNEVFLEGAEETTEYDLYYRRRLRFHCASFITYAQALRRVRTELVPDPEFKYGM